MEIKGNIEYQLHVDEDHNWSLSYTSTNENDLAIMAISQYILEQMMEGLKQDKENAKGQIRKELSKMYGCAADAKFGVKELLNHMQAHYVSYQEKIETDAKTDLDSVRLELLKTEEIKPADSKTWVENEIEKVKEKIISDTKKLNESQDN